MAVAPIFKFRNVRKKLSSTNKTLIYGVIAGSDGVGTDYSPSEVSAVVLTVQVANTSASPVNTTVSVTDGVLGSGGVVETTLVNTYSVPAYNAFDPLSGNLVLTDGLRIYAQAASANNIEIVVSLLEIANASAS
jgi:hypothetical protein